MSPDFEAAWKARGLPPGDIIMPADVATLKRLVDAGLPGLQSQLSASRPPNITETEHALHLTTGFASRILVCYASQPDNNPPSPIIVLFHGGIHVLGHPEYDLGLARRLVHAHDATVVCPSTRKAPEHPFPAMIDDAWAILQAITRDASASPSQRAILPARAGFILGGTSSGANFADVLAHLARDARLNPAVTGQVLVYGAFIDPEHVPGGYRDRCLSREQNRNAPVVDKRFLTAFREVIRPDPRSPLWAPLCSVGISGQGVRV